LDSFVVDLAKPIFHPAGQQAELVFVDYWDGRAVFLRKTEPGEDIEELMKHAKYMRRLRILTNRREKERRSSL
jgi:hypothetical protein